MRQSSRQSHYTSGSSSKSNSRSFSNKKKSKISTMNNSGLLKSERKYCIFTTKEKSNVVVATECPIPGKIVNEQLVDSQDLKYFRNNLLGQSDQVEIFNFDQVCNESIRQDRFYSQVVSPTVKSFVEENASVILFGPTDGGKTYTLKGKTGIERGILPRAVEDIFNIVRNSERREEELEAINHRMMQSDEEGDQMYPESYSFNRTYQSTRVHQEMLHVPERMFLRVQVYQIFADKVLDLLSMNQKPTPSAKIENYIDKDIQEVVSKVSNITEKAVFSLEDFYSVLQEAFKNKRIQSSAMSEHDMRKKAHFVIGLTLVKRTQEKKLIEISTLNFVELAGSEQAVAEDTYFNNTSIKQFVTQSFNGISSQILKAALRKKQAQPDDGDVKVVNCIRNTLTQKSNIILICNVNPSPQAFEHSLPALKFCGRIRDYILKKYKPHKHLKSNTYNQDTTSTVSVDDMPSYHQHQDSESKNYRSHTSRQYDYDNRKSLENGFADAISQIKDEINRQQRPNYGLNANELEKWAFDQLESIESLKRKIIRESVDRQSMIQMQDELEYLKEKVIRMRNAAYTTNVRSPRSSYQQSYLETQRSKLFSLEKVPIENKPQYESYRDNEYYTQQTSNQDQDYFSHRKTYDQQDYQSSYQPLSTQRQMLKPHTLNDYNPYPSQNLHHVQSLKQLPSQLDQDYNQADSYNNDYRVSRNNHQQQQQLYDGQIKQQQHEIQVYQRSPTFSNLESQQNATTQQRQYRKHSTETGSENHSNVHSENDFLNKVYPQSRQELKPKKSSISESPNTENKQKSNQYSGFRVMPNHQANLLNKFQGDQSRQSQQLQPLKNPLSPTDMLSQQLASPKSTAIPQNPFSNPLLNSSSSQTNQLQPLLYPTKEDLLSDFTRLLRLGDHEGIKIRVAQLYQERATVEKAKEQIETKVKEMGEELTVKNQMLEEQDKVIVQTHQEFQNRMDEMNQQSLNSEKNTNQQTLELVEHLKDLQKKVSDLEKDKEQLLKAQEILELENKELSKIKEDAVKDMNKYKEENEKLKSNYDILKEHEMNIIKDYEGKKAREVTFYEQKLVEMDAMNKEERQKTKALEEQVFALKEDLRKIEFELDKTTNDKQQLDQQIADLTSTLDREQEAKQELKNQIQQLETEFSKLEEQRDKLEHEHKQAHQEISKLHCLIEEMDKTIQSEQNQVQELTNQLSQKEQELNDLQKQQQHLEEVIQDKDSELQNAQDKEEEYKRQLAQMGRMHEELEMQLTQIKAKEYDKVDFLKKCAELEAKIKYLQVDNETLVRERNNLDIANVTLQQEKQGLEQHIDSIQEELDFFKQAHEQHLDNFDQKFDQISAELAKMKQENIQLKERERHTKKLVKEMEEENEELRDRAKIAERRKQEMEVQMNDIEKEMRLIMNEREKDVKDSALRHTMETKFKEENRGKMLEDIQNMIKQYKHEKNNVKQGYISGPGYSTNTSGYY